jgi:hypothetical protein
MKRSTRTGRQPDDLDPVGKRGSGRDREGESDLPSPRLRMGLGPRSPRVSSSGRRLSGFCAFLVKPVGEEITSITRGVLAYTGPSGLGCAFFLKLLRPPLARTEFSTRGDSLTAAGLGGPLRWRRLGVVEFDPLGGRRRRVAAPGRDAGHGDHQYPGQSIVGGSVSCIHHSVASPARGDPGDHPPIDNGPYARAPGQPDLVVSGPSRSAHPFGARLELTAYTLCPMQA